MSCLFCARLVWLLAGDEMSGITIERELDSRCRVEERAVDSVLSGYTLWRLDAAMAADIDCKF